MCFIKMSEKDRELIEMAYETTYKSSIRKYIEQAESAECRKRLQRILESRDVGWEE